MPNRISIIIPVYNEALIIRETIEHLYALEGTKPFEIILVDGHPEKSTLNRFHNDGVIGIEAPKGRGSQMNRGAAVARGDILLFMHADTFLPPKALDLIDRAFRQKNIVGGAFGLGIASDRWAFRLIETVVVLRTRLTRIPYGDQAIFLNSRFFHQIGGYRDIPIMEDVELMGRIKGLDQKIAIVPSRVLTSPRRWDEDGVLYCTIRNWILMSLFLTGVKPEKLARFYRS